MRCGRSGDRQRLLAVTVALGLLTTVATSAVAGAADSAAGAGAAPRSVEPTESDVDGPIQAPVQWTAASTSTTGAAAAEPAGGADTATSEGTPPPPAPPAQPPGGADEAAPDGAPPSSPPTSSPPSTEATETALPPAAESPDDAGTPTTGADTPALDVAFEPPAPVVGAANPFAGAQRFAVVVAGDLRAGGTNAGAVAAGGEIVADGYAVAGTTATFGEPVTALAGGRITGSLTNPAGALVAGAADPSAATATQVGPGLYEQAFTGVHDDLTARSRSLAATTATVTPTDAAGAPLASLAGADVHLALEPGVNRWTVSATDLASVAGVTVDGAPTTDQPLVVSVTGADVTLDRPVAVSPGGDAGLLWNLPDATAATVDVALPGSLLAPAAGVDLGADLGGTLVAASLDQQAPAAVGAVPFEADLPPAAEPATAEPAANPAAGPGADPADPEVVPGGIGVLAVPVPGPNQAVVSVKVGGDRTGVNGVTPLAGVVLQLYNGGPGGGTTPVLQPWATCTSDADGDCSFVVPIGPGGVPLGTRYWVRQASAPAGWFANAELDVGDLPVTADVYEFRTPGLNAGSTYVTTGPSASWMLGTGTGTTASGGVWQNSRVNPALPPQCGLRVALVLDVSGSVPQAGVRNAGTAFVSALGGTPSEVALFTFASDAPANATNNQNRPLTSVSAPDGVTTVNSWVNGVTTGGGTNWDRGLAQVAEATAGFDIAVVVTDGEPTFYNSPFEGPGNLTRFREVENAIFSSNALKALGTRVVAVGVGAGVSDDPQNLAAVSGPTAGSDYFQTVDYAGAAATLRELALGNCAGSISVVKQVVPNGTPAGSTTGASPTGGWDFAASTATPGVTIDPPAATTDDATGALNFALTFPGGTASAAVSITETLQPGFTLHQGVLGQNAVCTRLDTGASVPVANLASGFTVTGNIDFPVSCQVYNAAPPLVVPATIQVDKSWVVNGVSYPDGSQPAGMTAELLVDGTSQPWGTPRTGLLAGDTVGIADDTTITLPLCTLDEQVLTPVTPAGPPASLPTEVELVAGDNLYTATNVVTCEAELTLLKEVSPAGAVDPALWDLDAAAPDGALAGPSGPTGTTSLVTPLELYTLSESGGDPRFAQRSGPNAVPIPGSTVSWLCVLVDENGEPIPPANVFDGLNGGVRVPLGQRASCTATNVAVPLTLAKTVVNDDGGTAVAGDFQLTATPVGPLPLPEGLGPVTVAGTEAGTEALVRPGIEYEISETGPDGYTQTDLVCVVGGQPPTRPQTIVLDFNQVGTCTVTNDDEPASLTLVKSVVNDHGGTAVETDWTLSATAEAGGEPVVEGPTPATGSVSAGAYTLAEDGPGGYAASAWVCEGNATPVEGATLTVANGEDVTCTVTNDDEPATLTLVKVVDPGDAGQVTRAPADWIVTATPGEIPGQPTITGNGDPTSAGGVDGVAVLPGAYALTESTDVPGYEPGEWSCEGGALDGTTLIVAFGDDVTCSITNTAVAPVLTLIKQVDNGTTGTAAPTDWTLEAGGPVTISGATGEPEVTAADVEVGAYDLGEDGPGGYTASPWTCTDTSGEAPTPVDVVEASVTLTEGAVVTCTVLNTAVPPTPPPTTPPTTTPPAPSPTTPESPAGSLPFTGGSVVGLLAAAAVLLGVGVPLLLVRRRRTSAG